MIRDEIKRKSLETRQQCEHRLHCAGAVDFLRANPKEYAKHVLEDARPEFARK